MTTFRLESSYHKEGLYQDFANGKVSLESVLAIALREGANDQDYQEEMLLNHVMGFYGDCILTYDKDDDLIEVWSQMHSIPSVMHECGFESEMIDNVIRYGKKISEQEYIYYLPTPIIHEDNNEALTEICVCIDMAGSRLLATYWEDAILNEGGEWDIYDGEFSGLVTFDELAPSEIDILASVEFN